MSSLSETVSPAAESVPDISCPISTITSNEATDAATTHVNDESPSTTATNYDVEIAVVVEENTNKDIEFANATPLRRSLSPFFVCPLL